MPLKSPVAVNMRPIAILVPALLALLTGAWSPDQSESPLPRRAGPIGIRLADAPGGGVAAIEGPQDSDLQIASVPRGPGLLSTPAGIAVAVLLALSLAANAVMFLLLRR